MKFNRLERVLWAASVAVIAGTFFVFKGGDALSLAASLVGASALIFVSKGRPLGQALTIVFALLYGIISYRVRYYGEMITYLGMTAPAAAVSLAVWLKHPYRDAGEVEVSTISRGQLALMAVLTAAITAAFYFILMTLGNAALGVSTISIATSFLASYLTACRSPFYALAYAANDLILVTLWTLAAWSDSSCVAMVACFAVFFINDVYGFFNWRKMRAKQRQGL